MTSVFRIATEQAIKEIIEENAECGRFGHMITEESMRDISIKIVDLFEMTLELRSKTREMFTPSPQRQEGGRVFQEESPSFPKTKRASEIYTFQDKKTQSSSDTQLMPHLDVKLPRKRFEMTLEEKERVMRR